MKKLILIVLFLTALHCSAGKGTVKQESVESGPPYLGIIFVETRNGIRIVDVFPGSPAHKAGLLYGDLILSINGSPVKGKYTVRSRILSMKPGDQITVEVLRDHTRRVELKATLRSIPPNLREDLPGAEDFESKSDP